MPDWKAHVRRQLRLGDLAFDREETIVEELAGQLEDLFQASLRRGRSPDEAEREALANVESWGELAERIADSERPSQVPERERRLEGAAARSATRRRPLAWLQDAWLDIRHSARSVGRSRLFAAVALLTLALGIGAATSIFTIVDSVLLRPLPYQEPERIAIVWERFPRLEYGAVSYPNFLDWQGLARSFEAMTVFRTWSMNLLGVGDPLRVEVALLSASAFPVLGVEPFLGRPFTHDENREGAPRAVVLSHSFWQTHFVADPAALGKTISLDGHPCTVVGVMPPQFRFPATGDAAQILAPIESMAPIRYQGFTGKRDSRLGLRVLARVLPGVTLEAARKEMEGIARQLETEHPDANAGVSAGVDWLHHRATRRSRAPLLLLAFAVAGLMLVACANVASLLLARVASREREIALRVTLGAGGGRLARMLLTEGLALWLCGGVLGIAVAWAMNRALVVEFGSAFPRAARAGIDLRAVGLALALSLVTGCLFALLPVIRALRPGLTASLRAGGPTVAGPRRHRLRRALVAVEAALALVLLIGAGLNVRTFHNMIHADPGLDPEDLLSVGIILPLPKYIDSPLRLGFYDGLLERVRGMPGVRSAATAWRLPFQRGGWQPYLHVEGQPPEDAGHAAMAEGNMVSPGYFRTMGIPLLAGRDFGVQETPDSPGVVVVDERIAARYWPDESPIGKRLKLGEHDSDRPWLEVIGVVGHVHFRGVQNEARWQLYIPEAQNPSARYSLVVRTHGDPTTLVSPIRKAVLELDPELPLASVSTMAEDVGATTALGRLLAVVVGLFALVSMVVAAVGFYGVVAGAAAERTREIAVRMAIGARTQEVVGLVLRQGMVPVLAGLAAGLVMAIALGRFAEGLLFGVSYLDPLSYTFAVLFIIVVALAATALPASRASAVDPNTTLRSE